MNIRYGIIIVTSLAMSSIVAADTVYSWKDANDTPHYGDSPPEYANAHVVDLPELTVIENYGDLYQPVLTAEERGITKKKNSYTTFSILAPKNKQAIRANNGDVTVILSLQPNLLPEHQLSIFLNGKPMAEGALKMVNLTNLNRGEHKIYAIIKDKAGKEIVKSKEVVFTIVR